MNNDKTTTAHLPRDWEGKEVDRPLTEDLANVLACSVAGSILVESPEVQRVMSRYRASREDRAATTYRVLSRDDFTPDHYLVAKYVEKPEDDRWDRWGYCSFVFRYEGDRPVECLGEDGGEPEDQTLGRDWSWVVGALNDAYQRGRKDAAT